MSAFTQSTSILDAWRAYALADLTRGFDWADGIATGPAPTLFERGFPRLAGGGYPAVFSAPASASPISVGLLKTKIGETGLFSPVSEVGLLQDFTPGLQRYVVAPSFAQRWGENSAISVSAIFAYQRFAGLGLGLDTVPMAGEAAVSVAPGMARSPGSYGTGMRLDVNTALTSRVSWKMGVQSRVNMDAFNNYHGVYSEPGSFDIPASVSAGLGVAVTPRLLVDVGMQRVMYGGIAPFTSSALPTRFLVLLGSGISPTFAWQNLDVYSAGFAWRDTGDGVWSLHYTTREQPLPTSPLLQSVLEPYLASHNVEFGFARGIGAHSSVHIAASYAPSEYVLGLPTSNPQRTNIGGSQVEYQALWTTRF